MLVGRDLIAFSIQSGVIEAHHSVEACHPLPHNALVAEELDRLDTHVAEARHVLGGNQAMGRRLDFLMQEFNREANTLGSKAMDTRSTQAAVDLKVYIEQMREQVQNIE